MIRKFTFKKSIWLYIFLLISSFKITNAKGLNSFRTNVVDMSIVNGKPMVLLVPNLDGNIAVTNTYTISNKITPLDPVLRACVSTTPVTVGSTLSATVTGNNTASGYTTQFVLLDATNNIVAGPQATASFVTTVSGIFKIVAVNYSGSLTGLIVGQSISSISGSCWEISAPKCFDVQATSCISPSQVILGNALTATIAGNNTASGYTTQYVLTDAIDVIVQGPLSTASFTPTVTGSYKVYAINYSGTVTGLTVGTNFLTGVLGSCAAKSSPKCFTVVCPTVTNIASNNTNPSSCGASDGSIKICGLLPNIAGYTINYTKNGSPATALINQTSDAGGCITIPNLTAGSYTDIVVSSTGCTSANSLSVSLSDPSAPSTPTGLSAVTSSLCTGSNTLLNATGVSGASYIWSVSPSGASFISSSGIVNGATASNTLNTMSAGSYTVSVSQMVSGCISPAATTTVVVNGLSTAPSIVGGGSLSNICPSTTVDLTTKQAAVTSGQTYEWHTVSSNPNLSTMVLNPSAATAGTYYLYSKSTIGGCYSQASNPMIVTISSCSCTTSQIVVLGNALTATIAGNNTASGYTTQYVLTDANDVIVQGPLSTASFTPTVTGSYKVYAINYSGTVTGLTVGTNFLTGVFGSCAAKSSPKCFTVVCPTVTNIASNNTNPSSCGASDGSIKICGLPANSSGWTINYDKNGVSASSLTSQTSDASGCIIISGLTAGIYTNIKASSVTCVNASNGIDVTLTDPNVPQVSLSANASSSSICSGGSTTLSATCLTGTLKWFTDAGLTGTPLSSNVVSPTISTTYYASCVSGSCKSVASSVLVTVNPAIVLTSNNFTKNNPTSCNGNEGAIKICGLSANTNYLVGYNKNGVTQSPVASISDAAGCIAINNLMAGSYDTFIISNVTTTCSIDILSSITLSLTNPSGTTITLGASQNPSVCGLNDGFIQISGLSAGTQYSVNYMQNGIAQTPLSFLASSGTYTLSGLTAANYTNIFVSNNSCQSNALSKSLSDPITANISLGSKTDPTTCSANDGTFTVSGLAQNTAYILSYSKDGFAQTPISFTSVGTSYQVAGLLSGNYTNIRVTNNGCTSNSVSAILSDPSAVVISTVTPNNPSTCKGADGSITVTGLVQGTTYTIKYKKDGIWQASISYNATGSSYIITGLTAGAYTNITASNGGCVSNSLSLMLVDPEPAVIGFGTITQPTFCGANNGSLIITGLTSGLSYILNYVKDGVQQASTTFTASGTSFTLSGLVAANYTGINVTQAGCISNTLNVSLSNPGGAIMDVVGIDPISCLPGNEGKLLVTGLAQGLNYILNYSKNGVAQTPISFAASTTSYIIDGLTAATYTNITVTQASCVSNVVNVTLLSPGLLVKPALSLSVLSTNCSIGSADLTGINASNLPSGTILEWHTATPATAANKVADPTSVGSGSYYAVFYNGTTKCYGATTAVTVIKVPCANPDNANVTSGSVKIIQVLANDKNPDGTPAVLTEITTPSVTTFPTKGNVNVNPDGTITYTPNANASGIDTFIYQICDKANPTVCDTALVTVNINCTKPVLTIENISCTGTDTYSVTFSSDGEVSSNFGKVSGTTVTNIPTGSNVRLTSTSICGVTSMLDVTAPTCPISATCSNPVSLSVGQAICTGNGTYVVSYSISNGTLTVSSGTINQNSLNGTTTSGTISVPSLTNITISGNAVIGSSCPSQVITVIAPANCQAPSCNDGDIGISYSTVCNSNDSYNINYTAVSGATVTSSAGSFVNLTASVTLTVTETGCTSRAIIVTPPSCLVNSDVKLQVKVFLQGAFFSPSGATDTYMRDDLRSLGVIPTTEPFTAMGNNRFKKASDAGGQTIGTGILGITGINAIVDWVFVELRDAANPATVLKTRAALVQRDGDVVEANDGVTPVTFTGAAGTSYYVSIKHRNHLGVMTATPILMAATGTVVDFTSLTSTQLWDKGLVLSDNSLGSYDGSEQVTLGNGKMGLWAGNAINTDSKVKYSGVSPDPAIILSQVIAYPGNTAQTYNYDFVSPVYMTGDINMDGKVKYQGTNTDPAFILFNIINKYLNNITNKLYNFDFMVEQIP